MHYVRKGKEIEKQMALSEMSPELGTYLHECANSQYSYTDIPLKSGKIHISKPSLFRSFRANADLVIEDEKMSDLFEYAFNLYASKFDFPSGSGKERYEKARKSGQGLAFHFVSPTEIPYSVRAYPGSLGFENNIYFYKSDSEEEKSNRNLILEVKLNLAELYDLESNFRVRYGIKKDLHEKATLIAEAAVEEMGFDYEAKTVRPEKNMGYSVVCLKPKEIPVSDLTSLLTERSKGDSFKGIEMGVGGKEGDERGWFYLSITRNEDKQNTLSIRSTSMPNTFDRLLEIPNPMLEGGSNIYYAERERSKTMESISRKVDKISKKIDSFLFKEIVVYDRHPWMHPVETKKRRVAYEDSVIIEHLKSFGIRPNDTRKDSCLIQYDRSLCLEKAEGKKKGE